MKKSPVPEQEHRHKRALREQSSPPTTVQLSDQAATIQRVRVDPKSLTPGDVLNLQHTLGNHAVGQLLAETGVHARATEPRMVPDQRDSEATASIANAIGDYAQVVQRKASDGQVKESNAQYSKQSVGAQAPSITKAAAGTPAIQRINVPMPKGVQLTGGNGVSVLWKKSKKSEVPHVSVGHGVIDNKKNTVPVTNFHYKFGHAGYYHWDDTNASTTFTFRGGSPTEGVYTQTSKQARKFGITLQRPANLPAPAPVQAPVQPQAPAPMPVLDIADEEDEQEAAQESVTPKQDEKDVPENWWED